MTSFQSKILFLFALLFIISIKAFSQQLNNNLEFNSSQKLNCEIQKSEKEIHSIFKAVLQSKIQIKSHEDSIKRGWFYRKLFSEDFVILNTKDFILKVNPLLNIKLTKDLEKGENFYTNTRGIEFKGNIGEEFSFYSSFYENQSKFETYITDFVKKQLVVPGQGAPKFSREGVFDYSSAEAYISFSPNMNFNLQLGHSKHFIGDGYRSLLLSDNSFSYPFVKFSSTFGKFQYVLLWSQYQSFSIAYYNYHFRKYSAINYLSYIIKPGFEISLFESVIWPANTKTEDKFNLNYFNPVILFRGLQYELNSEQNVMLGLNAKIKVSKFSQFFMQIAVDDIDIEYVKESKYAFQVGVKYFDLFHNKLKNQNLFLHAEYNQIANYTYSYDTPLQNYSHYNQEVAHPAGSGLKEMIGIFSYNYKKIGLDLKYNQIINSSDTLNTNFGSSVFLPDNSNEKEFEIAKNIKTTIQHISLSLKYTFNPVTNLQVFVNVKNRKYKNEIENTDDLFVSFGIRTKLNNYYFDAF